MPRTSPVTSFVSLDRRAWLQVAAATFAGAAAGANRSGAAEPIQPAKDRPPEQPVPTEFQIACMTLPYGRFPLQRALTGIKTAGYRYVAWGTAHQEKGGTKPVPVLAGDAAPNRPRSWVSAAGTSGSNL